MFRLRHLNVGVSEDTEERLKVGDTGLDPPKNLIGSQPVAVSSCCHPEFDIACHVNTVHQGSGLRSRLGSAGKICRFFIAIDFLAQVHKV